MGRISIAKLEGKDSSLLHPTPVVLQGTQKVVNIFENLGGSEDGGGLRRALYPGDDS